MVQDTRNNGYLIPKLGLQGQKIQDDIKHPAYSQVVISNWYLQAQEARWMRASLP